MDNFSIDLDQALNELERQESEELKLKQNKPDTYETEVETNQIIQENTTNNLIQTENDLLESELNEIMQSLVIDNLNDLKTNNEIVVKEEVQEQQIVAEPINEPINLDSNETFPIQIKRLESIELDSNSNNLDEEEKRDSDTIDEKFSSPNEDSECYFDTIEISSPTLTIIRSDKKEIQEVQNEPPNQPEDSITVQINEKIEQTVEIESESVDESNKNINLDQESFTKNDIQPTELIQNQEDEETNQVQSLPSIESKESYLIQEPLPSTQNQETDLDNLNESITNSTSPLNCFESLNDLNRTDLEPVIEQQEQETSQTESNLTNEELVSNEPVEQEQTQAVNNLAPETENVPIEIIDYQTEWSQMSESEKTLGLIAPQWMPDSQTDACLKCFTKFSFRTRRHHCRACGLIFCSKCCFLKLTLPYNIKDDSVEPNKNQLSRCCNVCFEVINKVNNLKLNMQKMSSINTPVVSVLKKKSTQMNQNQGNETLDSETTNESEASTSTKMVRNNKSVRFSDGVVPGNETLDTTTETTSTTNKVPDLPEETQLSANKIKKKSSYLLSKKYKISNKSTYRQNRFIEEELINRIRLNLIKNNFLPPILDKDENIVDTGTVWPDEETLIKEKLLSSDSDYITFMLLRNLKVDVRIINFDCGCSKQQKCWLFVTNGLCLNGQEEFVFVLKCNEQQTSEFKETQIPREILYHVMDVYDKSAKGYKIAHMSHLMYDFESSKDSTGTSRSNELLNNKENVGFFYYYPSEFHFKCCLKSLSDYLPEDKFLIGYLIQRYEVSWAKLFPLRLYLSIGERFNCNKNKSYPTCIISDRYRKSVFGEIGHTIMSLLCDVRNFQYTIAQIDGLKIQLENTSTRIIIPESQYDLIVKSILTSNDYVFSLACLQSDDMCYSHLVAVENENLGSYTNKTISFNSNDSQSNENNKLTGAGFVVFNGALKANLTNNAKLSVIEDGVMIQIETETMNKLKQSLQSMKPFRIETLKPNLNQTNNLDNNVITIEWTKDSHINKGVFSIIDKRPLTGVKSLRLSNTYDYVNETKGLRWTEIYLIQIEDESNVINDNNFNLNRFADMCSTAFCTAITPLLEQLINLQKIYQTSQSKGLESKHAVLECATASNTSDDLIKYSRLINPFKVALRISVDKDQVGYLMGMNGSQITEDLFLANLDNELIQLLNHASSFNISIVLEFVFYVQERFNCSNKYVIQQ